MMTYGHGGDIYSYSGGRVLLDFSSNINPLGLPPAVEKAFQEAVEAAVNERLKGGTPPKKAPEGENSLEKQIEAAMARGF